MTGNILNGLGAQLAAISAWVDDSPANKGRDLEAQHWGRLAKITEEAGEVIAAFIGVTGQNPRKGVTHDHGDVLQELLDVALTALAAYEHMTDNGGGSLDALADRIRYVSERAGL